MPESAAAKLEELRTSLQRHKLAPADNRRVRIKACFVGAHTIRNEALDHLYRMRRALLREQYGDSVMEVELWHGTDCSALGKMLQHGLQPPSDTAPSDSCPSSGPLHTTL